MFTRLKRVKMKYYPIVIFGLLFVISSYSRDEYIPFSNKPLSMIINDRFLPKSKVVVN
jgi:hypothetical protein